MFSSLLARKAQVIRNWVEEEKVFSSLAIRFQVASDLSLIAVSSCVYMSIGGHLREARSACEMHVSTCVRQDKCAIDHWTNPMCPSSNQRRYKIWGQEKRQREELNGQQFVNQTRFITLDSPLCSYSTCIYTFTWTRTLLVLLFEQSNSRRIWTDNWKEWRYMAQILPEYRCPIIAQYHGNRCIHLDKIDHRNQRAFHTHTTLRVEKISWVLLK